MKKLVLIAITLMTVQAFAQQKKGEGNKERMHKMQNLSPEEAATMQTKRLTLHLDLNEKQQAEVQKLLLANAEARKAKMEEMKAKREKGELQKPTKEERLKMANARLDHQIAMKSKMKEILSEEQFAKWEKMQARMAHKGKEKRKMQDNKRMHQKKKE